MIGIETPAGVSSSVVFESSNLPIIKIQTDGLDIPYDPRIIAEMSVIDNGPGARNHVDDPATDFEGRISIEIRGAISRKFPKKSYALETQDADGNNANVSLLGMPTENDWILHAPYSDKTLMRNVLAYHLATQTGHYASRTQYCELLVNGEYMGIYVLMEKIKIDNGRIDLADLNPEDIEGDQLTGGYIIRLERNEEGDWESLEGGGFRYHHPQADRLQPEQQDYIRDFITNFEHVLAGPRFTHPTTGYPALLDVVSAIDYFILQEIGKNVDGFRRSIYMHKDRDSRDDKLHLGPVWDFNIAFGNNYEGDWASPYHWARYNDMAVSNFFWWNRLMEDEVFATALQAHWWELRGGPINLTAIHAYIDSTADVLDEAQQRNYQKWPILDEQIWPNPVILHTYEAEVDHLKDWLAVRIGWLDANMPDVADPPVEPMPDFQGEIIAYPNPFSNSAEFLFRVESLGEVEISIYDLVGREVQSLVNRVYLKGIYTTTWPGSSKNGKLVPSGIYLYDYRFQGRSMATGKVTKISNSQ
jgi:hypothetical protein